MSRNAHCYYNNSFLVTSVAFEMENNSSYEFTIILVLELWLNIWLQIFLLTYYNNISTLRNAWRWLYCWGFCCNNDFWWRSLRFFSRWLFTRQCSSFYVKELATSFFCIKGTDLQIDHQNLITLPNKLYFFGITVT